MTKFYRRKHNRFEITATRFADLETGPVVVLMPDDFDAIEVPWSEFKSEWEEVPAEGEGEVSDDDDDEEDDEARLTADIAEGLAEYLKRDDGPDGARITIHGASHYHITTPRLLAILDAARKSLAAPAEPSERRRVGETMWKLGKYFPVYAGNGQADFVQCDCDDDQERESSRVTFHFYNRIHGYLTSGQCSRDTWDAARARWIADGRPAS